MELNEAIKSAVGYYQAGDLEQTEKVCKEILSIQPDNIDALNFIGILYYQQGLYNPAEEYFRKALQFAPDNADVYCNIGNTLRQKGQLDEAIQYYEKAIQINPAYGDTYNNLGHIYHYKGQIDEAITYYQKAVELEPDYADAYYNLGAAFQDKRQFDLAIDYYQKAVELEPDLDDAYYNLGIIWQEKMRFDEAIASYQKTLELNPKRADAYNNLGTIYKEQKQYDKALIYFYRASVSDPGLAKAHVNLGSIYQEQGRLDEAITFYKKALEIDPDLDYANNNMGRVLQDKGQVDHAIACFQNVLKLNPDNALAHWNMARALLLSANFKQGWQENEWRWKINEYSPQNFQQPLWDGSDIEGRSILLHAEQGFDDTIQFIRYAPLVAQKGARVIVECQREVASLLKGLEGIGHIVMQGDQLPAFDIHCPLLSLPLVFNTTIDRIPAKIPYISADPLLVDKWKVRMQQDTSDLKIGVTWSRNSWNKYDQYRLFALGAFGTLGRFEGISWYSLQQGKAAEQAKHPPEGMKLIDYMEETQDFMDMAALIQNLDLVISLDSPVAHLAGALGKQVWTLLPFSPDWRWMLDREDSPWYPTMRLFRQPDTGEWEPVIEKLGASLRLLRMSS
jgi:tetratricopeptide (TPR) repeat protein